MPRNTLLALAIVTLVLGLAHIAYYYPKLPDEVAIHFNGRGEADGFGSKQFHSWMMAGLQMGLLAMFIGLGFLITALPSSLINIPNREYWLSEEHKPKTIETFKSGLMIMGIGTQVFLVGINHITTLHNLGHQAMIWFWPVITCCCCATIVRS